MLQKADLNYVLNLEKINRLLDKKYPKQRFISNIKIQDKSEVGGSQT